MPASGAASAPDAVPTLTLVFHPDVSRLGERARVDSDLELARSSPSFADDGGRGRAIEDRYVSRSPVRMRKAGNGFSLDAEPAARAVVNGRPVASAAAWQTFDRDAMSRGVVIELAERVVV